MCLVQLHVLFRLNKFGVTMFFLFEKVFIKGRTPRNIKTDAGTEFNKKNVKTIIKTIIISANEKC